MVIRVKWATMLTWVTSWTGWYGWNEMSVGLLYPNKFSDFPKWLLIILSLPNVGNAPVPLINAPTLKSSKSGNFSSGVGNRGQWTLDIPPPHQPSSFFILNIISLSASSVRIVGNYSSSTDQRLFLLIAIVNTSNSRRGIYVLRFCKVTCLYRFQEYWKIDIRTRW